MSIISDIDDTVKVTNVLDRRRMWEATFYKPFDAVDGMPASYRKLTAAGAPVHYVSSSPWHLAEPLLEFLSANGLPVSSITLKHFRLKDRTSLNILKPGRETKPPEIEAILARYPGRRFILIGDSGEDDPEVYAQALRRHPSRSRRSTSAISPEQSATTRGSRRPSPASRRRGGRCSTIPARSTWVIGQALTMELAI